VMHESKDELRNHQNGDDDTEKLMGRVQVLRL
jgi:hypothetical protein